jgi:hypothetical protein
MFTLHILAKMNAGATRTRLNSMYILLPNHDPILAGYVTKSLQGRLIV